MNAFGPYDQEMILVDFISLHLWLLLVILVGCILVFTALFFYLFRSLGKRLFPSRVHTFSQTSFFLISSFFSGLIVGGIVFVLFIFILLDHDGYWWQIEEPARHMVDKIRFEEKTTHQWPKTIQELEKKYPEEMLFLEHNAKIHYVSDNQGNFFVLFIRPSKYFVLLYTSMHSLDFDRFALDFAHKNSFPAGGKLYPPSVYGPWDQLPQ